jgi:hypothetical protein
MVVGIIIGWFVVVCVSSAVVTHFANVGFWKWTLIYGWGMAMGMGSVYVGRFADQYVAPEKPAIVSPAIESAGTK